ncbi:MAG TPA: transcriptional regulator [Candidatus Acidoferrales bacterium]|nr:transcriptional regulator [Candidatus Acidoferrales bacterium]
MGRRPREYSQAERLALMMRALASRVWTINELAQELGVSRRQVYRDLDRIEKEGHPLVQSGGVGERTWQLPLGYRGLRPIMLTPLELMSLYLARSNLSYLAGTPFVDDLDGVLAKLKAGLPQRTINHLERIGQCFIPLLRPLRRYEKQKEALKTLQKALLLQRTARIRHRRPSRGEEAEHKVDPYVLLLYQNGLYLWAYSHTAAAYRSFAVERIAGADLTGETFSIRRDFSREKLNESFGIMEEAPQTVRIRFHRAVAHFLKERQWHPTQKIEETVGGDVIVSMRAGGLDEIASWVLSWGENATALEPPALVETVLRKLSSALAQYRVKNS